MSKESPYNHEKENIKWFHEKSLIYAAELNDITYRDFLLILKEHIEERLGQMQMFDSKLLQDCEPQSIFKNFGLIPCKDKQDNEKSTDP